MLKIRFMNSRKGDNKCLALSGNNVKFKILINSFKSIDNFYILIPVHIMCGLGYSK